MRLSYSSRTPSFFFFLVGENGNGDPAPFFFGEAACEGMGDCFIVDIVGDCFIVDAAPPQSPRSVYV